MGAAYQGDVTMVRLLLRAGAATDIRTPPQTDFEHGAPGLTTAKRDGTILCWRKLGEPGTQENHAHDCTRGAAQQTTR